MSPAALRQLVALAAARRGRALAELERACAEERRLAGEAEVLARARAEDLAANRGLPMAQIGLRAAWAEAHQARLQSRRTELAGEIARLRRTAAVLVGRHAALDEIAGRAETGVEGRRLARAEREALPAHQPRKSPPHS